MSIGFIRNTCIAYKQTVFMTQDNLFGTMNFVEFVQSEMLRGEIAESSLISQFLFSASIGGIFGLCCGASIISCIEVIYFVVVRMIGSTFLSIPTNVEKKSEPSQMDKKFANTTRYVHNNNVFLRQYIPWSGVDQAYHRLYKQRIL